MKIVREELLISNGTFAKSSDWQMIRGTLHRAIKNVTWPAGSSQFIIYPESGKKSGEGNGVKPIKSGLIDELKRLGWRTEGAAKNALGQALGDFDAVIETKFGPCVLEWETGNISSSHRSMNKMAMLLSEGKIATGTLVVPSRELYKFLTDRIGNFQELEPYFGFWRNTPCKSGVLEVISIEHDGVSTDVPKIPKGTDGRAKTATQSR